MIAIHKILKDARLLRTAMNIWPPFVGAGIVVKKIDPDFKEIVVNLHDRLFNRNYVGVHFGGSIFSMTDPFMMLMVMRNLSPHYYVWDIAANIEFRKPGKGLLTALLALDGETLQRIEAATVCGERHEEIFTIPVRDADGETVALVQKTVYVRLKPEFRGQDGLVAQGIDGAEGDDDDDEFEVQDD